MTETMDRFPSRTTTRRKQVPAEQTNAENFYYLKQMQNHTPMVVVLADGTELTGWIEWYDKTCIKLNRTDAPNLLLFKHAVKFMFKEEERHGRRRKRPSQSR
jgi:sRNA-binding regulator protein Hfq